MAKQEKRFTASPPETQGAVLTHIITDNETGVQYLLAISPNLGSGMTMLADAQGKPLIRREG